MKDMDKTKLYFEECGEQLLCALGITKAKFARMMNIDRQNVNKLFATKNIMTLRQAARMLDVPFELLISYADDPLRNQAKSASLYMAPEYVRIILPYRGLEEHFKVECMGEVIDDPDEVCKLAMYDQKCDQFDITINLKTKRLTKWIYAVDFRIRANMKGQGTYVLLDKDMSPIIQMSSRADFDSIDFVIDNDGVITDGLSYLDFSIFSSEGTIPDDAGVGKWG